MANTGSRRNSPLGRLVRRATSFLSRTDAYESLGSIYTAIDIFGRRRVAVKLESAESEGPSLEHEYQVYRALRGLPGIPRIHWFGSQYGHDAIVMDLLGLSLEDAFNKRGRMFSVAAVLTIAQPMVSPRDATIASVH